MTGGGFGGSVIALVEAGSADRVLAACVWGAQAAGHPGPTAFVAHAFVAHAGDGARRLDD